MNGFIYLKWDTGIITRHTLDEAARMADNKFLGKRIVKAAYWLTDF